MRSCLLIKQQRRRLLRSWKQKGTCAGRRSADNRYHLLFLTEAGHEVVPKVQEALNRIKSKTRRGISDDEYGLLLTLLKNVLHNLTEVDE